MKPPACGWLLATLFTLSTSLISAQVNPNSETECVGEREVYSGLQNVTISGRACQVWNSQRPHRQTCYMALDEADRQHNFCRNPVSTNACHRAAPWCYTTDGSLDWEYCDVPLCDHEPDCDMALGMESGNITDAQITASHSYSYGPPHAARLNSGGWWQSYGTNQYLKIDLLQPHTITKLLVQGHPTSNYFTRSIQVFWSSDGFVWHAYSNGTHREATVFETNRGRYDTAPVWFNPPIRLARLIVVVPIRYNYRIALRLEVFGCQSELTVPPPTNVTQTIQTNTRWDLSHSPYLIDRAITISRGATLTIQAGVQVVFLTTSSALIVEGCLTTETVEGLEVHFQSPFPIGRLVRTALWQGITFSDSECHPVVLRGATISNAIRGFLIQKPLAAQITNVTFISNTYGILHDSSSPITHASIVHSCMFVNNERALSFRTSGNMTVTHSSFIEHSYGLELLPKFSPRELPSIEIRRCFFSRCSYSVQGFNGFVKLAVSDSYLDYSQLYLTVQKTSIKIERSVFTNAAITFQYRYPSSPSNSSVMIENTTMSSSTFSRRALVITNSYSRNALRIDLKNISIVLGQGVRIWASNTTVKVYNSKFLNTRYVALELRHIENGLHQVEVTNSTFTGNRISLEMKTNTPLTPVPLWSSVAGNTFVNNTDVSISFDGFCLSSSNITGNCFNNPTPSHDIRVMLPRQCNPATEYQTLVSGNWFPVDIRRRVFDFFSRPQLVEVTLRDNYLDPFCTQSTHQDEARDFQERMLTIGGRLTGAWVVSAVGVFQLNSTNEAQALPTNEQRRLFSVNSTIHIPRGSSLVITENVTLSFYNSTGIFVEGRLTIQGTPEARVVMTTDESYTRRTYWAGILYHSADDSTIQNVEVRNAETGISLNATFLTVTGSKFSTCQSSGVEISFSSQLDVTNTSFVGNSYGIRASSTNNITAKECSFINNDYSVWTLNLEGNLVLQSCLFDNSRRYIIYNEVFSGLLNITNCSSTQTQNTAYYGLYVHQRGTATNMELLVQHSTFRGSLRYSTIHTVSSSGRITLHILNNTFSDNMGGIFYYERHYRSSINADNVVMFNNTIISTSTRPLVQIQSYVINEGHGFIIHNNTFLQFRHSAIVLSLPTIYRNPTLDDSIQIANNRFAGSSTSAPCVNIHNSNYQPSILIEGNTFMNNTCPVVVQCLKPSCTLTHNVFNNPSANFDLQLTSRVDDWPLFATLNWWGSPDKAYVRNRISFPTLDASSVVFEPYWLTDGQPKTFSDYDSSNFFKSSFEIGGILTESTTLDSEQGNYTVVDDIIVPVGLTLTLNQGVTLVFRTGGMFVQGTLLSRGSMDEPVLLMPHENSGRFSGLFIEQPYSELLRLTHGSQNSGLLEIYRDDAWVPVCHSPYANNLYAQVACNQLQFHDTRARSQQFNCSGTSNTSRCSTETVFGYSITCSDSATQRSLQECSVYYTNRCPYGQTHLTCESMTSQTEWNKHIVLVASSGQPNLLMDYSTSYSAELTAQGAWFQLMQPGLTGSPNSISLMALNKPGWYLKYASTSKEPDIKLESRGFPSNSYFDRDATFILHEDVFIPDTYLLEPESYPGYYVTTTDSGHVTLVSHNATTTIEEGQRASFRFQQSASPSRKRRAAREAGEMTSLLNTVMLSPSSGLSIKGRPPIVSGVTVLNSSSIGIQYIGHLLTSLVLSRVTVRDARQHGILLQNLNSFLATFEIIDSSVTGSLQSGISLNNRGNLSVNSTTIASNRLHGIYVWYISNAYASVTVTNSTIDHNGASGCYITRAHNVVLLNNAMTGNHQYAVYVNPYYYSSNGKLVIANSTFYGNSDRGTSTVSIEISRFHTLQISRNRFVDNFRRTLYVYASYCRECIIRDNQFINNSRRYTTLEIRGSATRNISATDNVFNNPEATFELSVNHPYVCGVSLWFGHNDWGVVGSKNIMARISAFNLDVSKMFVNIWPYRSGNELVAPSGDGDLIDGLTIGGEVNDTVILPATNGSYTATSSILIRDGANLVISPGVTINFLVNMGIRILGNLTAGDGTGAHVTLQGDAYRYRRWRGVIVESCISDSKTQTSDVTFLRHLRLLHASDGIVVQRSPFRLSQVAIIGSNSYGVRFYGRGPFVVDQCSFGNLTTAMRSIDTTQVVLSVTRTHFSYSSIAMQCILRGNNSIIFQNNIVENFLTTTTAFVAESRRMNGTNITIINNLFRNIRGSAIQIRDYGYGRAQDSVDIVLQNNTFHSIVMSALNIPQVYQDYASFRVLNNTFIENGYIASPHPILNLLTRNVLLELNQFIGNKASSVVYIRKFNYRKEVNVTLSLNTFTANLASTAIILTDSIDYEMTYNVLEVSGSDYALYVGPLTPASGRINASYNYWGTTDSDSIDRLIFDQRDDASLASVIYEPYLQTSKFTCEDVSNCSNHGFCIRPNICDCEAGWGGPDCSQVSCSQVEDCYSHGQCVGPNMCSCDGGWLPPFCSRASCLAANNCSNRGVCVAPNRCACGVQFSGTDCSGCAAGHWGSHCTPCPACVNGQCDTSTGLCSCYDVNWGGDLCDRCSYKFYGPRCLPLIRVLQLAPSSGPDVGGTQLQLIGHNFPETDSYKCRFGGVEVAGRWVSEERIVCLTPQHAARRVLVRISPGPGQDFQGSLYYTFNALCPASACGRMSSPPHGLCSLGSCICHVPWTGDDCSVRGLPPVINRPHQGLLQVSEGQLLQLALTVSEGTLPLDWTVLTKPRGMTFSSVSASLIWPAAAASVVPHLVSVRCRNQYGSDTVTFNVTVPPAYHVILDSVDEGPFAHLSSVLLSGRIVFNDNGSSLQGQQLPVVLRIRVPRSTTLRTLKTSTYAGSNAFFIRYYHSQRDAGQFEVDAGHPTKTAFDTQVSWRLYGVRITVAHTSISGYLDPHFYPAYVCIRNMGADTLTSVMLQRWQLPYGARLARNGSSPNDLESLSCRISQIDCTVLATLQPDAVVCLDLNLQVDAPFRGYFSLAASTREGVSDRTNVRYVFRQRAPQFVLSVSELRATVTRGRSYTYEVNVTNVGLRPATNVQALLPDEPLLSLASFGKATTTSEGEPLIINTDDSAVLVLRVSPRDNQAIGEANGNIVISSIEISQRLNYRIIVASSNQLDLTVNVEDEYTYFAADSPPLSGAMVRLVSRYGNIAAMTLATNETGSVTFHNITENYYTLYTSAPSHSSDVRVLLITPTNNVQRVFLPRTAVTYSWSVTRVTFEDRYEITLEADFETFVPIPVVTLRPRSLDLEVLERGLIPVIDFELTNHGLIAADGVTFTLPTPDQHPFLRFEMDAPSLGRLPANTTWHIPVRVIVLEVEKMQYLQSLETGISKRGIADRVRCLALGIAAAYSYFCDRERFNSVQAALRKTCPGGSGLPSGLPGGGGWTGPSGGPGGPSGVRTSPAITSSLTCDDIINCFKAVHKCYKTTKKTTKCISTIEVCAVIVAGDPEKVVTAIGCGLIIAYKCHDVIESWISCYDKMERCLNAAGGASGRRKRSVISREDIAPDLAIRYQTVEDFSRLAQISVGDLTWIGVNASLWLNTAVLPALSDISAGGSLVTSGEYQEILSYPLPPGATLSMAQILVQRINNTVHGWDQGILEGEDVISYTNYTDITGRIMENTAKAREAGFENTLDWYGDGYDKYEAAEEDPSKGVCAKVRIQIQQRLAITREAFRARLELENGETDQLSNIKVEIVITNSLSFEPALVKFAIGSPEVSGISDVNGTGVLDVRTEGSAEWLIIPYSEAAPTDDVDYDIGGILHYTVNGNNVTVPLFPDTVSVTPDPRLFVHYFWEKYVKSDDALTPDVIEPTVPFSLGILLSNVGYGTANNMRITTAQPEIIDNEKGLLIDFQIIGAQLGAQSILPSLTVNFGDLQPMTTAVARWLMTSSLKGTFSNYSATFENINPLGDPKLSVLESIDVHELLRVVLVDTPSNDHLPDYLVFSETLLDFTIPDRIYVSHDGTHPLDVCLGNITDVSFISSVHMKISVETPCVGWVYFRAPFTLTADIEVSQVIRNDGRQISKEYNFWIDTVNDEMLLQLVDYFIGSAVSYSYDVAFNKANLFPPAFALTEHYTNVSESQMTGGLIAQITATDGDTDQTVTYQLVSPGVPFTILTNTGDVTLSGVLDRELQDEYILLIQATDDGIPKRSSTAVLLVTVFDVNDNAPRITADQVRVEVEETASTGYVLTTIAIDDPDAGNNGAVQVRLENTANLPLSINLTSGSLEITGSLLGRTGEHTVIIVATDQGVPVQENRLPIEIIVVRRNILAPDFINDTYMFSIVEKLPRNFAVGRVEATDGDSASVTYALQAGLVEWPFRINSSSGTLFTRADIDRERQAVYDLTILARDDGALPTGPRTGTASVHVTVLDINDNAPTLPQAAYTLHVPENLPRQSTLLEAMATDADEGANADIADFRLSQTPDASRFTLRTAGRNMTLLTNEILDREVQDRYNLTVTVSDAGVPPMSSVIQILVQVTDVNDNAPRFIVDHAVVMVTRVTSVNTEIYVLNATDVDLADQLIYSTAPNESLLTVNPIRGSVRVARPLINVTWRSYNATMFVSDGTHQSTMLLQLVLLTENSHTPEFHRDIYRVSVNESVPVMTVVGRVGARDDDGQTLAYSIISGNEVNTFTMDASSGELQLLGMLDRESMANYVLVVEVSDGGLNGVDVRTDRATLLITVTDTNEYSPQFDAMNDIYDVDVTEEALITNVMQVTATDEDLNQTITYRLEDDMNSFHLDSVTGWLSVVGKLDREERDSYILPVTAMDDGVPVRSSVAMIRVHVNDINDNSPQFPSASVNVTVSVVSIISGDAIYVAKATDADRDANGDIRYSLTQNPNMYFSMNDAGELRLKAGFEVVGSFRLEVQAMDLGTPSRSNVLQLRVEIIGQWRSSSSTTKTQVVTSPQTTDSTTSFTVPDSTPSSTTSNTPSSTSTSTTVTSTSTSTSSTSTSTTSTAAAAKTTTTATTATTTTAECNKPVKLSCDLENVLNTIDDCGMMQECEDDFDWTRHSGKTPSSEQNSRTIGGTRYPVTGPERAQGGSYYMFVEASGRRNNDTARITLVGSMFRIQTEACLHFYYMMNGYHIGTLNLYSTASPESRLLWSTSRDQLYGWQKADIDVQLTDMTQLTFESVMTSQFAGDIAVDSISIDHQPCHYSTTKIMTSPTARESTLPETSTVELTTVMPASETSASSCVKPDMLSCDVENILPTVRDCGMVQECDDDFDWTRNSGKTPSSERNSRIVANVGYPVTGPKEAYEGSYYVYVEATGRKKNDVARMTLRGSAFNTQGDGCLQFYYMMNGFHIGTLNLYKTSTTSPSLIWSSSGDKYYGWHKANINVELEEGTELTLEAVMTGEFAADIAIDSVTIVHQQCEGEKVSCDSENMLTPDTDCYMEQMFGDDFDWTRNTGKTPSSESHSRVINDSRYPVTGPGQAQSGSYYMYVEASKRKRNEVARFAVRGSTFDIHGSGCLHFYYMMNGYHIGTLNVFMRAGTEETRVWSMSRDQLPVWQKAEINIDLQANFSAFVFEAIMTGQFAGDIAVDSVRYDHNICSQNLWKCTFESADNSSDLCGMKQDTGDGFDWTPLNVSTPSEGTGPGAAHSGTYYIYIEASNPRQQGDTARILSPPLTTTPTTGVCVHFTYHMYGQHIGSLRLFSRSPQTDDVIQWQLSGQQTDSWVQQSVAIKPLPDQSMIGFTGVRGDGYAGDIAVDDVIVVSGAC